MKKTSMKKRLVAGVASVAILSSQFLSVGAVKSADATQFAPITSFPKNTSTNDRGVTNFSVIPAVTSKTVFTTNFPSGGDTVKASEIQPGKTFARYSNIAYYNGKNVDLRITIKDFKPSSEPSPDIKFEKRTIGIIQSGFINVRYKHEFLISGTDTPIELPTVYTFGDIDLDQRVTLDEKQITGRVITSPGSGITFARENGNIILSSNSIDNVDDSDRLYFVSVEMKTSTVEYDFSVGEEGQRKSLFGTYHSIEYRVPKKSDILKLNKSVKDKDESGLANTLENTSESFTYYLHHTVLSEESLYYFKNYQISDNLPDGIDLGDIKVIEDRSGVDVTNKFDIKKTGNDFVATLINPSDSDFYGKNYTWTINSKINPTADLTQYKDASGNIKFTNTAKLVVDNISQDSDKVVTTVKGPKVTGEVAIAKTVDKTEAKPEEVVTYGIDVTNNANAPMSAVVTDDLKQLIHTDYVVESVTIDGKKVTDAKDADNTDVTNSILTAKFNAMQPNQKHHIEFKVKLTKDAVQGEVIKNTAKLNTKNSNEVTTTVKVEQPVPAPTPAPTPTPTKPSLPKTSGTSSKDYFGLYVTVTVILGSSVVLINARKRK